jgi:Uncharacterized protein conserved in bacteria (DUF2252)
MANRSLPHIGESTKLYETWLASHISLIPGDLRLKHAQMKADLFPFLRATYYRWAEVFPEVCKDLASAPEALAVGDLHIENFGTWRDSDGRLIWGVNDFDEASWLPYTNDLVRLLASANMAIDAAHIGLNRKDACAAVLEGYQKALEAGGHPFVLAEHHPALREMARHRLKEPEKFWEKLTALKPIKGKIPGSARKAITRMLPQPDVPHVIVHRVAGLGSLGRQRFVAIGDWHGGRIAREAKALAPSAAVYTKTGKPSKRILYQEILDRSIRCPDPWVKLKGRWIVRRLAPDCSRIELSSLPAERDEIKLLQSMGFETANIHLGTAKARVILKDLKTRPQGWLYNAARQMVDAITADWERWRRL